ncbi:hypothetical protein A8709_14845 [Paenibacillus pectinilyticus]|uniref:Lipoprotein n=1 Tax=Paenibacillus pectinilyticus TaxID=512399 RepID=A0A1C1A473_9BACL|nr:hypothetical protein [Paenibacillus pectinilyticus]OCT15361.1 hypothetical protein A8709_14845 [Paenibacillus pectinilyticus]
MKKLANLFALIIVITSTGCKNTNEVNRQADSIHAATSHAPISTSSSSSSVVQSPVPIVSTPAKDQVTSMKDMDVMTMTDFTSWNHPIKSVLDHYNMLPVKMELSRNKTYPTFYFSTNTGSLLPFDNNENYYGQLLREISKANGYWDYSLVIQGSKPATIEVIGDRDALRVRSIKVNGSEKGFFYFPEDDELYRRQDEAIRTLLLSLNRNNWQLQQMQDIDLDQDGIQEKLVSFSKSLKDESAEKQFYVLQKNGTGYRQVGDLNSGSIGWLNGMDILTLNGEGQPFIYLERTNGSGSGFNLYKMEKGTIVSVDGSFPPNGDGFRGIAKGADGHYIKTAVELFIDRRLIQTFKWDGNSFVISSTQYEYGRQGDASFEYPDSPEKVLECFLTDTFFLEIGDDDRNTIQNEMQQLVLDHSLLQLDLHPNDFEIFPYYEMTLKTVRLEVSTDSVVLVMEKASKKLVSELVLVEGQWKIKSITVKAA